MPGIVTGALTGGQYEAHEPLQTDLVDESGANRYSVRPLEFVSTVTPLIVVVFSTPPADAELPAVAIETPATIRATTLIAAIPPAAPRIPLGRRPSICSRLAGMPLRSGAEAQGC